MCLLKIKWCTKNKVESYDVYKLSKFAYVPYIILLLTGYSKIVWRLKVWPLIIEPLFQVPPFLTFNKALPHVFNVLISND